ncbi:DeoR/GlpR family DNA-binding transcription regulator [Tomitella biformata]|uniref:DeoR/GlpR family DNA-binding transcription regulator n=1 Tax=Tomitella biformata TaxID=630403 RepID=UPI000465F34A|nr:DeoR/GlpR family DNA-binding transcription regulator [Tomitella biformata]
MYAEERQQAIATLIGRRVRVSVAELSVLYGVTTETVRRDLAVLDRAGLIHRVHGGAMPVTLLPAPEQGLADREKSMSGAKNSIAKAALTYLPPVGGSILIDAGTTTARMASLIPPDRRLTMITNSVPIAARLAAAPEANLHLLGGRIRGLTQAAVGPDALSAVEPLLVDVAFIGTNALSSGHGLSTPDPEEAAIKRAMVKHANHVVVLADSSKIGRDNLVRFAALSDIDVLVTDSGIDPAEAAELLERGVEVIRA